MHNTKKSKYRSIDLKTHLCRHNNDQYCSNHTAEQHVVWQHITCRRQSIFVCTCNRETYITRFHLCWMWISLHYKTVYLIDHTWSIKSTTKYYRKFKRKFKWPSILQEFYCICLEIPKKIHEKVSSSNSDQNLPKTEPARLHAGIKLTVLHDTRENG